MSKSNRSRRFYGAHHLKTSNTAPRGQIFKSKNGNDIPSITKNNYIKGN